MTTKSPKKIYPKKKNPSKNIYVDNKHFLKLILAHKKAIKSAEKKGLPKPRIPEEIGKIFLMMAEKICGRYNFCNYSHEWLQEMQSDGLLHCIKYICNFDPKKSKNPFGFFSQILYFTYVNRIKSEKKQSAIRFQSIEKAILSGVFSKELDDPRKVFSDMMRNREEKKALEKTPDPEVKQEISTESEGLEAFQE